MKIFSVLETEPWHVECGIVIADNEEEAMEIAKENQMIDDGGIWIKEIPMEKGYTYIGGHEG